VLPICVFGSVAVPPLGITVVCVPATSVTIRFAPKDVPESVKLALPIERVAVTAPTDVGAKTMVNDKLPPGAIAAGNDGTSGKLKLLLLTKIPEMDPLTFPVLRTIMVTLV